MKEYTRIITAQITLIETSDDDRKLSSEKDVRECIKTITNADDVLILKLQDFVREVDGKNAEEKSLDEK